MSLVIVVAVLLCFSGVSYLLVGGRLLVHRPPSIKTAIGFGAVALGVWVLGGALETLAISETTFLFGRGLHLAGNALFPAAVLMVVRTYTSAQPSRLLVAALLLVPALTIGLAATNTAHQLLWYLPAETIAGDFAIRPEAWGPWVLLVHMPYGYALLLTAMAKLLMHSTAVGRAHRRALLLMGIAGVVPMGAGALYYFGVGSATFSYVPLVIAAMLPIYAWMIVSEQIVDFTPIAYETVFQNMEDPVVVLDNQRRVISLNRGAEALLKLHESDVIKESLETLFGEDATAVYEAIDTGRPRKMMTTTGRFLHVQASPIDRHKSGHSGRVLMFRDVSDVERAQQEVRNSERLLRTLVDHSVNGIVRLRWQEGPEGVELRSVFVNRAAAGFLNQPAKELMGCRAQELMAIASSGMQLDEAAQLLRRVEEAVSSREVLDIDVRVADGDEGRWLHVIVEPVGDEVAVMFVDITDKKAKELQMESIAWNDPLTGVLNRRGFERDAARRLADSADDATGALMFADLNEFKQINDRCGHEVGDELLRIAAQRLRTGLRPCDIIGRPGGDEFVALIPDVDTAGAELLAERMAASLEEGYRIHGQSLRCTASIGLALYPEHANTLTGLLRAADQAMYRAKSRARGGTTSDGVVLLEKAI